MNTFQQALWDNLMALVEGSEAFYYADQERGGEWYRIFNYRLASYTEFLKPAGLECRGHTFRITEEGHGAQPLAMVCMPVEKFFNLYENPMTIGLDLSSVQSIWDKLDGSLISSYLSGEGLLWLKSKGSLASDQAKASELWLLQHPSYMDKVFYCATRDYTVNFEWTAPENRIVIGYEQPQLRVLNVRSLLDGSYMPHQDVLELFEEWTVHEVDIDPTFVTMQEFVDDIPNMQGIEGYVIQLDTDQRVKIKTLWYLALHHTKDNINSPRRLFEAVLEEATDDMRTLFHDDPLALQTIQEMEDFVAEKYNHMVDMVERFFKRNKHLSRKDYAILGQQEFAGTFYFSLAMNKYLGREFSYKEFLKSKWKQLGLKDVEKEDE